MTAGCITNSTSHQAVFLTNMHYSLLKSKISLMFSFSQEHTLLPWNDSSSSPRSQPWTVIALSDGWTQPSASLLGPRQQSLTGWQISFWHGAPRNPSLAPPSLLRVRALASCWPGLSRILSFSSFLLSLPYFPVTQFLQKVPVPLWASCCQHVAAHSTAVSVAGATKMHTFCSSAELHSIKELCSQSSHKEQVPLRVKTEL